MTEKKAKVQKEKKKINPMMIMLVLMLLLIAGLGAGLGYLILNHFIKYIDPALVMSNTRKATDLRVKNLTIAESSPLSTINW